MNRTATKGGGEKGIKLQKLHRYFPGQNLTIYFEPTFLAVHAANERRDITGYYFHKICFRQS